jgi:hypothetical protein
VVVRTVVVVQQVVVHIAIEVVVVRTRSDPEIDYKQVDFDHTDLEREDVGRIGLELVERDYNQVENPVVHIEIGEEGTELAAYSSAEDTLHDARTDYQEVR